MQRFAQTATQPRLITRRSHGQIISVIPSDSRPNLFHTLRVLEGDFSGTCDCEAFRFRGTCKHVEAGVLLAKEYAASHPARQTRREPRAVVNDPDPFVALMEGV